MEMRKSAHSDEVYSTLGIGAEHLEDLDQEATDLLFDEAMAAGVNLLDFYMPAPDVRDRVGHAIFGRRDQIKIQGHLGAIWQNEQYKRTRNLDEVKESFEDLLTRLKTDYIDIGMIHYVDTKSDYQKVIEGGTWDYAAELKKNGVIKRLGFSSHDPVIAKKMAELSGMEVCMFSINPAYDMENAEITDIDRMIEGKDFNLETAQINPKRLDFYAYCDSHNIDITVMKAFGGGTLLDSGRSPFGKAMNIYQCMKYALDKPAVVSVILGFESVDELKGALRYDTIANAEKDYSDILTLRDFSVTGRCMYCGHCQPCPVAIDVAAVNKFLDLAEAHTSVPETVAGHYQALAHHASECIHCGYCERNCPFGVAVRERMKRAQKIFGE